MANQPSVYKQIIGARIPRELYHKVAILAEQNNIKVSDLIVALLEKATENIVLEPEHYEQIAEEIRRAVSGTNPRKSRTKKEA